MTSYSPNAVRVAVLKYSRFEKDQFYFDASLTRLEFNRNKKGEITDVVSHSTNSSEKWIKTDKPIPVQKTAVVDEATMASYEGEYQLTPNFGLTITLDKGSLWAQGSNQGKIQIFPESQTLFYAKVVNAKIEFIEEEGKVDMLILHQNGQKMEGKRK